MAILEYFKSGSANNGAEDEAENGRRLVLPLILSGLCLVGLSLTLIWLNLQRTQMGYTMRELGAKVEELTEFSAKLTVEREYLLSRLGERAVQMGLRPAQPGQTRRMEAITGPATTAPE